MRNKLILLVAGFGLGFNISATPVARAEDLQGAALLKCDIMAVFAHPDDETGTAGTLAYYALGRDKAVVNVYCTRGEGGGNMVGTQWGDALGVLRETELRKCLEILGVRSCFFLDRKDWAYTESLTATMRKWDKEATLERLVRLVRTLRPEVIITMNPAPTPGQHGHHQAAAVLATEAFTASADPNRFALQLAREGLTTWQPRRLYFGGANGEVITSIPMNLPLTNGKTAGDVAAQALVNHRSQGFGNFGSGSFVQRPQRFVMVKSYAPVAGVESDLLVALPIADNELSCIKFAKAHPALPVDIEIVGRPAVTNYRSWVTEQQIEHVAEAFTADLPVVAGEGNAVELLLRNSKEVAVVDELLVSVPTGWRVAPERLKVQVLPQGSSSVEVSVTPPDQHMADGDLVVRLESCSGSVSATARLHPLPRINVAHISRPPAIDGSDDGWRDIRTVEIAPTAIVQGNVANSRDSSAQFRIVHDGVTLFVDVVVKDDIVVSNIEPNDIRGHWRSDSVEICLDPVGGVEDTLGCFKLGVFPFDTFGVVRAARDADAQQGPVDETAPKTRIASRRTNDGYRIQVAIPLSEIGADLAKSRQLGFNLIIYDGDKPNATRGENINKSRIAWAFRPGVQGRPEDWGRIDLE